MAFSALQGHTESYECYLRSGFLRFYCLLPTVYLRVLLHRVLFGMFWNLEILMAMCTRDERGHCCCIIGTPYQEMACPQLATVSIDRQLSAPSLTRAPMWGRAQRAPLIWFFVDNPKNDREFCRAVFSTSPNINFAHSQKKIGS